MAIGGAFAAPAAKQLLRRRAECVERSFAHLVDEA